jgi:hypothetical protein
VIYVIAAYSITVGTLALYAALLQHRARVLSVESAQAVDAPSNDPRRGTNIGAALLAPFWMFAHGLRAPGVVLLALWVALIPLYARESWIPLSLLGATLLAASAALAIVGNRIVVDRLGVASKRELSNRQWPWAATGIVIYGFVLPWVWVGLVGSA